MIYDEMGDLLGEIPWLDAQTKAAAVLKWSLIAKNVAYNTDWLVLLRVGVVGSFICGRDEYLDLTLTGHLFNDVVAARAHKVGMDLSAVLSIVNRAHFPNVGLYNFDVMVRKSHTHARSNTHTFNHEQDQNAFYMPTMNSINMLAGLLLDPLFNGDMPLQLNVAAYGLCLLCCLIHWLLSG